MSFSFGSTPAPATNTLGKRTKSLTPTVATSGFGFGPATAGGAASAAPSLFGSTAAQTPANPAAPTANTTAPAFGAPAITTTAATPSFGSMFGQQQQQQPKLQGFGSTPATTTTTTGFGASAFGASAAKPALNLGSSFGAGTGASTGGGLFNSFGASLTGGAGQSMMGASMAMSQGYAQPQRAMTIVDKFKEIQGYWSTDSPTCQFKHYFYNMVHPDEVIYYKCPPNQDPTLYQQAMQDNPDPSCMVPVLAVGFEDLKKRITQQENTTQIHNATLENLSEQLDKIEQKHYLDTTVKLEEYKRRHLELAQRVLSIMKTVEVLRNQGYHIRDEEEALKGRLEAIDTHLKNPSHFRGRIQELQVTLRMLKDSRRLTGGSGLSGREDGSSGGASMDYIFGNEDQMRLIKQALVTAQEGLKNLTAVIVEDTRDLETMMQGYSEHVYQRR